MSCSSGGTNITMRRQNGVKEMVYIVKRRVDDIRLQKQSLIAAIDEKAQTVEKLANIFFEHEDVSQLLHNFPTVMAQLDSFYNKLILLSCQMEDDGGRTVGSNSECGDEISSVCSSISTFPRSKEVYTQRPKTPTDCEDTQDNRSAIWDFPSGVLYKDIRQYNEDTASTHSLSASSRPCSSSLNMNSLKRPKPSSYDCAAQTTCSVTYRRTKLLQLLLSIPDVYEHIMDQPSVCAELQLYSDYGLGPELLLFSASQTGMMEVSAADVTDPSFFWLSVHSPKLLDMTNSLKLYHEKLTKSDWGYCLRCEPQVNMNVCARLSINTTEAWYRARILSITPTQASSGITKKIAVFCVDYGRKEQTTLENIRPLHPMFAKISWQSFTCSLPQIGPPDGKHLWPPEVVRNFKEFMHSQPVFVAFVGNSGVHSPHPVELGIVEQSTQMMFTSTLSVTETISSMMIRKQWASPQNNENSLTWPQKKMNEVILSNSSRVIVSDFARCSSSLDCDKNTPHTNSSLELENLNSAKGGDCLTVDEIPGEFDNLCYEDGIRNEKDKNTVTSNTGHSNHGTSISEMLDNHSIMCFECSSSKEGITIPLSEHDSEYTAPCSLREQQNDDHLAPEQDRLPDLGISENKEVHKPDPITDISRDDQVSADYDYKSNNLVANQLDVSGKIVAASSPNVITPNGNYISFLTSFVQSPSSFWIHIVSEESQMALNKLRNELAEYAGKVKTCLETTMVQLNSLCCARFSADGAFYRTRIVGMRYTLKEKQKKNKHRKKKDLVVEKQISEVFVSYIDFGNREWLPVTDVYPLPSALNEIPPQAVCCSLVGISPGEPVETNQMRSMQDNKMTTVTLEDFKCEWPANSIKAFEAMMSSDRILVGYIKGHSAGDIIRPDTEKPLPLVVVDTSSSEDVFIGEELIRQGFAIATETISLSDLCYTLPETSENDKEDLKKLEEFQPTVDDFLSERNSYMTDADDVAVMAFGYNATHERRVCYNYDLKGYCYRGENCRFEHVRTHGGFTALKKPVFACSDLNSWITLPSRGSWVALEVTTVLNPSRFFAIFPFGTGSLLEIKEQHQHTDGNSEDSIIDSLEALNKDMTERYSRLSYRDTDYSMYAEGEIVACCFTADDHFYRARVLSLIPEEDKVFVFYVDYGNCEWVSESRIRQMMPQYMHLPFQAVECRLPLKPHGSEDDWTSQSSTTFFKEFVEGKVLCAKVLESASSGFVVLELYDTSSDIDININQYLVQNNVAEELEKPLPATGDIQITDSDFNVFQTKLMPG